MEYVLRCNDLKCRVQLHDRAVVTTCSHVFCPQCADTTGLSRSSNGNRVCPACGTQLINPDDVVVAGLNPTEDYKTSVLSGLSPTIIMECASRGLAFYSYQASQEIIYQEHLAKSLTEKYANLSQQMDQLINDANSQIKVLQDKMQAMQAEQATLEQKNHELVDAFREKSKTQQQIQKMYQQLKAQVMATQVAHAAGDEADLTLESARGDRFIDKLPGARMGTVNLSQSGTGRGYGGAGRHHNRAESGSSSSGQQAGGIGLAPQWAAQSHVRGMGNRMHTGQSAPVGTPSQLQMPRRRLPVLGSIRPNSFSNADAGPAYHPSPMTRQPLGGGVAPRNSGSFGFPRKASKRTGGIGNPGPLGR